MVNINITTIVSSICCLFTQIFAPFLGSTRFTTVIFGAVCTHQRGIGPVVFRVTPIPGYLSLRHVCKYCCVLPGYSSPFDVPHSFCHEGVSCSVMTSSRHAEDTGLRQYDISAVQRNRVSALVRTVVTRAISTQHLLHNRF